ncbi:MAG TPA: MFS transporter, partial [Gaiellaceae bacterium]|nr:MFS transporter [Gaiellaceae bacterium]
MIPGSLGGVAAALLAIELLDELVFGAREAAWPAVRDAVSLSYAEIGLLLTVPSLVSLALEPVLGLVSVLWRRRVLILGGGVLFAAALALAAGARSFWALLAAFALLSPASGAFVSLSQAALMDLDPQGRERNMARWTLAGGAGAVAGPLLLSGLVWAGLGWRALFAGCALLAAALVLLAARAPEPRREGAPP